MEAHTESQNHQRESETTMHPYWPSAPIPIRTYYDFLSYLSSGLTCFALFQPYLASNVE